MREDDMGTAEAEHQRETASHRPAKAAVDELAVQLDLADMDLRESVRRQLDTAVNVYLAARSRLGDALDDAQGGIGELRSALERVLHDLRSAYEAANDVIRRSRPDATDAAPTSGS